MGIALADAWKSSIDTPSLPQEMENQAMEDPSEVKWRVGTRGIRLEDLILVGLQHVSMGSWQAHVRLVQRPH